MAQRQFRSDDTNAWGYRYGDSSAGALTIGANTTIGSSQGANYFTITGTAAASTATTNGGTVTLNLPCMIHQTQGTGAGNWELNFITTISSNTATFRYPLMNTYGTGAQLVTANPYSTITITPTFTLIPPAWNGTTGGILFLMGSVSITSTNSGGVGGLVVNVSGFRGGDTGNTNGGVQGEGDPGVGSRAVVSANGQGAGGALTSASIDIQGGAGGSLATSGSTGGNSSGGTVAGGIVGDNTGTNLHFGGGGAGGEYKIAPTSGSSTGGIAGGIMLLITRQLNINAAGGCSSIGGQANGVAEDAINGGNFRSICAGSAAGGYILAKCQILNAGADYFLVSGGATSPAGGAQPFNGGAGGHGYLHIDYAYQSNGVSITNGSLAQRQDSILADTGGSFIFNLL